jgi:endonuclease/exonuclease/phosphatase family metal-dependent hydrolase
MKNESRWTHAGLALIVLIFMTGCGCDPLVTQFDDVEDGQLYTAKHSITPALDADTLSVMTWNIRFGAGRVPWFGDGCGDKVIFSKDQVIHNLSGLANKINEVQPDLLLVQEIDVQSKRTAYIDEVQWLLDHTYFNYATYASMWQAQYVPSDGLGRINTGQAVFSRWKITDSQRIQLPLRSDQDALTKYFYLRRNLLKVKIALPGLDNFYVLNPHLDAFSTDGTKKKQIDRVSAEMYRLTQAGAVVILGGDLNLVPPGSDSTDYCMEDKCPGEHFHGQNDHPKHKDGSNYTPEITWLQELYDYYSCSIPLSKYLANQQQYFTETPDWNAFWDRKIDYLFTNTKWIADSDVTFQNITDLSDHVPIAAKWEVPR